MRRGGLLFLAAFGVLGCSVPAGTGSVTQVPSTPSETAPPPTATPLPPTPVASTPPPRPPLITADTVGGLALSHSFAEGIVRSLAVSPDGSVVAAAEGDPAASVGTIQLYETATGRRIEVLDGHESGVWDVAFSPDGRYLASAGRDHTARVWDWVGGSMVASLDFPNEVAAVAFSPDSLTLAVGGVNELPGNPLEDAAIWTFSVDGWERRPELAEYWNIPAIAFTPDGARIVGGGTSRNVRVWRASDGAEPFILYHAGQVASIGISPDGSTAATALCEESQAGQCLRGAVWLWNLSDGKLIETLSDFPVGAAGVAYSLDGSVLFAASAAGTVRAYASDNLRLLWTASLPPGRYQQNIQDMALSADGRLLVTGGSGRIDVWRVGG